jgi:hypothetical protein
MSNVKLNAGAIVAIEQLKKECKENNVSLTSKKEYVRWVSKRDSSVTIETVEDYYKFNGGSNTPISDLNTFVPYHTF